MSDKPSEAELRARLTPERYRATQPQSYCINSAALDFEPGPRW